MREHDEVALEKEVAQYIVSTGRNSKPIHTADLNFYKSCMYKLGDCVLRTMFY